MTIKKLVGKGLLEEAEVKRPRNAVIEAGNRKFKAVFKNFISPISPPGMRSDDCSNNSICVVMAMREKGKSDWDIVPGFAYRPEGGDPSRHVWVREKSVHYDPTWSFCYGWKPENLDYYQVVPPLKAGPRESENDTALRIHEWGKDILQELKDLADEWNLNVLTRN